MHNIIFIRQNIWNAEYMKEIVQKLYDKVKSLENSADKAERKLPSACYFLSDNEMLCYPRSKGDGRHPYQCDGLTLWAFSSGNIAVCESTHNLFLGKLEGTEPSIAFFVGKKQGERFFPISITGAAKLPFEENIHRFTVYTSQAAYYFAETEQLLAAVRAWVDKSKRICFTLYVENNTSEDIETYLSAYFHPHLRHSGFVGFEDKWYKCCEKTEYGFLARTTEYVSRDSCMTYYAAVCSKGMENACFTTSRQDFIGLSADLLNCSESLQIGMFKDSSCRTEFTDTAIMGELVRLRLSAGEQHTAQYYIAVSADHKSAEQTAQQVPSQENKLTCENFRMRFDGLEGALAGKEFVFNAFLSSVVRQTDFCSRSKNYAGEYIGVRDIMQQIEAAVCWDASLVRRRIVETLGFIGEDGRPPRQYSYPSGDMPPLMDLRAYIDQGVWIISTVYTYLCYTNDYSILNEICGYYNFSGLPQTPIGIRAKLSEKKDSVLEHLLKIAQFLIGNLDEETNCLRALYGDWNDALDGLGKTEKVGKTFGSGVSVMASLQLYKNLGELIDILRYTQKRTEKIQTFEQIRTRLKDGLLQYAIVTDGRSYRILHGWGDNKSWFVGSYQDNDGASRDSVTANAFWVLSGMAKECNKYNQDILNAYERLDSKYGLKTFEPYFAPENDKVGRINRLPKGTAENGAVYIHGSLFGVWSLFQLGEARRAWEQIYKILPITHDYITTTPFVMPNSYIYNKEKGFDGESMSDWFTGSGCVLIKSIVGGAFGVQPTLDGVKIEVNAYLPATNAEICLNIKGCKLSVQYKKTGGSRKYFINQKEVETNADGGVFLRMEDLSRELHILVTD